MRPSRDGWPAESKVAPENILAPHRDRTQRRIQAQATVLGLQDGSDLNYIIHPKARGRGVIGSHQTGAQSLERYLDSTQAVNAHGLPLGIVRAPFETPQSQGREMPSPQNKIGFRGSPGPQDT